MGALDVDHVNAELESGAKLGFENLDLEEGLVNTSIQDAVKVLLQGLGEDTTREGLLKTPLRVAKALREGTRGYGQKAKDIVQGALFSEAGLDNGVGYAGGAGGIVVVRNIDLFSYCESCLLPFKVQCHVGYSPSGQRVVGLSKLSRVADVFAQRLQEPQRLANEICVALHNSIKPAGVAVALVCWHLKYPTLLENNRIPTHPTNKPMQGWSCVSAFSGNGVFENEESDAWTDYLALLKIQGTAIERKNPPNRCWCPCKGVNLPVADGYLKKNTSNGRTSNVGTTTYTAMVNAVSSILRSLGEDPSRRELAGTPHCFVQWLMNFKRSTIEMKLDDFKQMVRPRTRIEEGSFDRSKVQTELSLPFCSQCEHHLLPFHGVVHICYFHGEDSEPLDRSILQSVVHFHGFKLQVQERLTRQIVETISSTFHFSDVMVVAEASHICMLSRGIEKVGSNTATIAAIGQFSMDSKARNILLEAIPCGAASS